MIILTRSILYVLVGIPVALISLALVGATFAEAHLRRQMKRWARTPCIRCGQSFGLKAIQEARGKAAPPPHHNGWINRYRFIARWNVQCSRCEHVWVIDPNSERSTGADAR